MLNGLLVSRFETKNLPWSLSTNQFLLLMTCRSTTTTSNGCTSCLRKLSPRSRLVSSSNKSVSSRSSSFYKVLSSFQSSLFSFLHSYFGLLFSISFPSLSLSSPLSTPPLALQSFHIPSFLFSLLYHSNLLCKLSLSLSLSLCHRPSFLSSSSPFTRKPKILFLF